MAPNCRKAEPDRLFDGRLALRQPERGHRVGTDAVLLAAAAPDGVRGLIVDVGAGVGAVGLALAQVQPDAQVVLLEKNAAAAAFARENIALNGLEARARLVEADLFDAATRKAEGLVEAAELVVTNPPFLTAAEGRPSPDANRAMAHVLDEGGVEKWLRASLALLRPGGTLAAIHRADALASLLAALSGRRRRSAGSADFPEGGRKSRPRHLARAKGLESAAVPAAGPRPPREGRALHRAGGRDPPPRTAPVRGLNKKAGPKAGFSKLVQWTYR